MTAGRAVSEAEEWAIVDRLEAGWTVTAVAVDLRLARSTACGKSGRRQRTFRMTINPWNKNPDGTVRTPREVYRAVRARADEWEADAPFVHPKCEP